MKKLSLLLFVISLLVSATYGVALAGDKAHVVKRGYVFKNNQVQELRKGKLTPINKNIQLKNDYILYPNGSMISEDGICRKLKEGEGIDKNGHILFSGKQNGKVVLIDSPVNFYAYSSGKKVRTVTGVSVEEVKGAL
ncbi:DUF6799 domain-containing protein [Adhaeribacter aquaticus]|uniref:DUF6799 domain-containing protein n=1 Tax=Adhaeribacter aquaticus TaxID=299567 RepID=UPI0004118BCF|nr:DUF6799 domain-containing protein [Adhaeribacter aquaticus]